MMLLTPPFAARHAEHTARRVLSIVRGIATDDRPAVSPLARRAKQAARLALRCTDAGRLDVAERAAWLALRAYAPTASSQRALP